MDRVEVLRRVYELISGGDSDALGELMADDFVDHEETPGFAPTREGAVELLKAFKVAFPDLRFDPQEVLVSGDKVVARIRITGTHEGDFMGMPPTGKRVDMQAIDIIRIGDDGLAHEHWGITDQLTMMQQLGVVPEIAPG